MAIFSLTSDALTSIKSASDVIVSANDTVNSKLGLLTITNAAAALFAAGFIAKSGSIAAEATMDVATYSYEAAKSKVAARKK